MTGHAAVSINYNFTSGKAAVALRAADNKTSGRVDVIFGFVIKHFCRYNRFYNKFHNIAANLFQSNFRSMLRGNNNRINAYGFAIVIFNGYLGFSVRAQVRQNAGFAHFCKAAGKFMCQRNRQRHIFRCFVSGITEHHALVTGAYFVFIGLAFFCFQRFINAKRNIRRLFVNGNQNAAGIAVKAIFSAVITDIDNGFARDFRNINIAARRNFADNMNLPGCNYGFAGNTAMRVLCQNSIKHSIRNLIGNFIRMPFRNRFGSK